MPDDLQSLYREELLDLAQHPECYGCLAQPDQTAEFGNVSCGDRVLFTMTFKKTDLTVVIDQVLWQGEGCIIAKAAASVAAQAARGESLQNILTWDVQTVLDLLSISQLSPSRQKCALVGLTALQKAIAAQELTK